MPPEQEARTQIDKLLAAAGWVIQDREAANLHASLGVAIREYPLKRGHGFADYLLYVDGQAAGVVEAKRTGTPLIAVEFQTAKYSQGLPDEIPAYRRPMPFCYQSTGVETRFTNLLEPEANSAPCRRSAPPDFGPPKSPPSSSWLTAKRSAVKH